MSTKHILPPPEEFFADDFPEEMTREEMIKMMKDLETKPPEKVSVMSNNVDLHLGPAEVKPLSPWTQDPNWWVKANLPNVNIEILALDVLIALMSCWFVWLMIDSWIYFFS